MNETEEEPKRATNSSSSISRKRRRRSSSRMRQQNGGVRLRKEVLTLEYRPDKPLLKSIGRQTHHLAKMGVRRRDGDFFPIESALLLAEQGAAVVRDQRRGAPLPLAHLHTLMGPMGVSPLKYAVFAQLVRAGYVVRRPPTAGGSDTKLVECDKGVPAISRVFHFPRELLDQFPSIAFSSAGDHHQQFLLPILRLPAIRSPSELTVLLAAVADDQQQQQQLSSQVDIAQLNGPMNEHVRKTEQSLLRELRRQHHEPWVDCRPRWWPSFHSLRNLDNWREYGERKEALLSRRRRRPRIAEGQLLARSEFGHDYDLFPDEASNTKPIYRILVAEQHSFPDGHPNFGEVSKMLANECTAPLLIATGTPTNFKISQYRIESEKRLRVPQDENDEIELNDY